MTAKSVAVLNVELRRLTILRLLCEQPGKKANASMLHACLDHLGLRCERHEVIEDMRYLELHQLVRVEVVLGSVFVATLRTRGGEVAAGTVEVEGVASPTL